MNLAELLTRTRRLADDEVEGGGAELWPDEELIENLNLAEREACIRARLIEDFSDEFASIELTEDDRVFTLHASVISVISAKIDGRRDPLDPAPLEVLWTPQATSGWPMAYAIQGETNGATGAKIVLDRVMPQDGELKMLVSRLPEEAMADDADTPEIGLVHHDALPYWALHLAFLKRDIDAEDPARAEKYKAMFEARFGIRDNANVYRKQRRHTAPRVRPGRMP